MQYSSIIAKAEASLKEAFAQFDRIEDMRFERVMSAFQKERIAPRHFAATTGYGYDDEGRDAFERVFAQSMGCEDALVRPSIASGTHALAVALQGLLRPGEKLLYATGAPYDTLWPIIGIGEESSDGSLADWGVLYGQVDLTDEDKIDIEALKIAVQDPAVRVVALQRSRGYAWRKAFSVKEIGEAAQAVHSIRPDITVMVDNCYGEFIEEMEPTEVGVDVIVGSLIKNPGGGLAPSGGYIAGKQQAVERCAYRCIAPGIGREVGSYAYGYQLFYQGLFGAPHAVNQALKTAALFAEVFASLGFAVSPAPDAARSDIIQAIRLDSPERLLALCRAVQAASPVDSYVTPEPWPMPGYANEVVMAAGTFVSGASIELSADAPLREPYIAYLQGGLTYSHGKYALDRVLAEMERCGIIEIPC